MSFVIRHLATWLHTKMSIPGPFFHSWEFGNCKNWFPGTQEQHNAQASGGSYAVTWRRMLVCSHATHYDWRQALRTIVPSVCHAPTVLIFALHKLQYADWPCLSRRKYCHTLSDLNCTNSLCCQSLAFTRKCRQSVHHGKGACNYQTQFLSGQSRCTEASQDS